MRCEDFHAAIIREGDRIAAMPAAALECSVRTCPGWDVARLVAHLGRVHRWAAAFLAGGAVAAEGISHESQPPNGHKRLEWYRESRDLLVRELRQHDPDEPVDTFAGQGTARFWARRQAHETAMHRFDVEDAVRPGAASDIEPSLATDGIDEWLTVFVPRFLERRGGVPPEFLGESLHFRCTDADHEGWSLNLTEEGPVIDTAERAAEPIVEGPSSDVLLAVWHRVPLTSRHVRGDPDAVRRIWTWFT